MIINKNTKLIQIRYDKPCENWLNDNDYFLVRDDSRLADKIKKLFPFYNFILNQNGELIDIEDDIESRNNAEYISSKSNEIIELKQKLSDTDYQAIKYAEGQISEEEYTPIKEKRQAWRDRINELEAELEVVE